MVLKNDMESLFGGLTENMSAEEVALSALQGIIAAEISMRRQELGMSQKDLAEKLGVSQGLVSRWERAETNFTLETLVRIASVLDLNIQSPIVPRPPLVYSEGKSNLYVLPTPPESWNTESYVPSTNYIAKEN